MDGIKHSREFAELERLMNDYVKDAGSPPSAAGGRNEGVFFFGKRHPKHDGIIGTAVS